MARDRSPKPPIPEPDYPPEMVGLGNMEQGAFAGYATCDKANDAQWRYLKNYSIGQKKPRAVAGAK